METDLSDFEQWFTTPENESKFKKAVSLLNFSQITFLRRCFERGLQIIKEEQTDRREF